MFLKERMKEKNLRNIHVSAKMVGFAISQFLQVTMARHIYLLYVYMVCTICTIHTYYSVGDYELKFVFMWAYYVKISLLTL